MTITRKFLRIVVAASLIGGLSACVVAPPQSAGYRGPSVYVETYPTYRYGYPNTHYYGHEPRHYGNRYYDNRSPRYYGDERRHSEPPRRMNATIPGPAQVHRDVRRSLGLPRLPGMP